MAAIKVTAFDDGGQRALRLSGNQTKGLKAQSCLGQKYFL